MCRAQVRGISLLCFAFARKVHRDLIALVVLRDFIAGKESGYD